MPLPDQNDGKRLYVRPLPSGGYVAIIANTVRPLFAGEKIRGQILVERRTEDRRQGHKAPIAAFAEREALVDILHALLPIAQSDRALGDALTRKVTIPVGRRVTRSV